MRLAPPSMLILFLVLGGCLPVLTIADSGPLMLGSSCSPLADIDPCNSAGYVCDQTDAGDFDCQYPEFDDPCLPSVGCAPDSGTLSCFELTVDGGSQAVVPYCGTPCNLPTDCLSSTATCDLAYLSDGGSIGACQSNACDTLFASCTVGSGAPDGTCLPGDFGNGVCYQSGPIATNTPCTGDPAIDAGAYLCQPNDLCSFGPSGQTACLAICGGGLACPGTTTCVKYYLLCLTPCSESSPSCDSPYTCQDLLGGGMSIGYYCTLP